MRERTQVAIIGAGPAGLLLGQLLQTHGIASVILERRSRAYCEGRIRAGVLEQGTVDLLQEAGVADRLHREGLVHGGIHISLDGRRVHVDLAGRAGGRHVTVYGQTEVVKDLIRARLDVPGALHFEAEEVMPQGFDGPAPFVIWRDAEGRSRRLDCDVIAGCDGFHGVARQCLPGDALTTHERVYPFAWLGILAEAPPVMDELIYARHARGFALYSMRSPSIVRHYVQCAPETDPATWPDARIWAELRARLGDEDGARLTEGRVLEKGVTPMRSFVAEPLRHGRLFLAGDAAHIVPPTGAKGLNLAAGDVHYLTRALVDWYGGGGEAALDGYSARALARVWKAQRFSWWMTAMLHDFGPAASTFDAGLRRAELEYLLSSEAALTTLAENYVGLPF